MEIVTWDPNFKGNSCTLSNNNLTGNIAGGAANFIRATHGIDKGKSYFEILFTGSAIRCTIAIISEESHISSDTSRYGYSSLHSAVHGYSFGYMNWNNQGVHYLDSWAVPYVYILTEGVISFSSGDTVGMGIDLIKQQVLLYKNGALVYAQPERQLGLAKYYPAIFSDSFGGGTTIGLANFGATAFKYAPTDGFISFQDAVNTPPYKKLYGAGNNIYGVQNNIFTKLADDFSALSETEKVAMFMSTDDRFPAIEELSLLDNFKVLTYSDTSTPPPVKLTAIPNDQLVLPSGLINIESFTNIDTIQVVSNLSTNSVCKVLVTTDLKSYSTYDFANKKWIEVDKINIDIVGISVQDLSNIDWSEIIKGKTGIGFAYLLKIENSKDACEIDKINLTVDMRGEWNKAIYSSDYKYGYLTNKILKLSLLANGDYKINYSEGSKNP